MTVATVLSTWKPRSSWNPRNDSESNGDIPTAHMGMNSAADELNRLFAPEKDK